jgi:rare lipoprotein A
MMRRFTSRPFASSPFALPAVALLAAAFALAGCQQRAAPKPVTQAKPALPTGKGIYKVGTPYQIDGVWYYPAEDFKYEETGIASWYGEQFHAKETANGEVFDLNALTAAHRTLPLPCVVEVTNLENGRLLQLRVNDRGPFARGRILDVSRRAAQLLGFEPNGTAKVKVRILVNESIQVASLARRNGGEPSGLEQAKAAPRDQVVADALPPPPGAKAASRNPASPPPGAVTAQIAAAPARSATQQLASAVEPPPLSEQVYVVPVPTTQIYVQAGSFTRQDNAARVRQKLDALGPTKMTPTMVSGVHFYRVRVGPLASVEEADKVLARVVESGHAEAKIVVD